MLENKDHPDQREPRDTEDLSVFRDCRVLSVLRENEELPERMVRTENPAHLEQEVHLVWMELLVQWETPAPPDPEECKARRVREELQESSGLPDPLDLRESLQALTWQL